MADKAAVFWSGGKDSALALLKVLSNKNIEVTWLVSTVGSETMRVTMHGVREGLIKAQAMSLGLPLHIMYINPDSTNSTYQDSFFNTAAFLKEQGITKIIFGDLFLDDIRIYREKLLAEIGLEGVFPLWNYNSLELAAEVFQNKIKAIICCADKLKFNSDVSGMQYDEIFISSLPKNIDPAGENGEFHTFVTDFPTFKKPLSVATGVHEERNYRTETGEKGFWFCDLLLKKG